MLLALTGCYRDGPLLLNEPLEAISQKLDHAIPLLAERYKVAGLSMVTIREGAPPLYKTYGHADLETRRPMREDTVFRAASLGKPVFAYVILSLSQAGMVDLDIPLYHYLKQEVVPGDSRSKIITGRMILSHTSGLSNLQGAKSHAKFLFDPGKGFSYSGHGYLYLQRVVEEITGKSFDNLANEIVFKPLEMSKSSFNWRSAYKNNLSVSYSKSATAFPYKEKPAQGLSAWSLFTTTTDYARFVQHVMKTYNIKGSIAGEMLQPHADVADKVKWGLGWGIQGTTPHHSFWHWGSMDGFRHFVVGYPTEGVAVIVMTNSATAFQMVDKVMSQSIGGSYPGYDWF
jgi:CubicO group peptidase (beta-lactamase class C family)